MPKYTVGLAIDKLATRALVSWHPINATLLTATFQHILSLLQVTVAYAPTEKTSAVDKDIFCLTRRVRSEAFIRPRAIIVLGDFNAASGSNQSHYRSVIGAMAFQIITLRGS